MVITDRGRTEKPLLRARPVRDIPKSTPRLNPPVQCGLYCRRRAFGRISFEDTALILLGRRSGNNRGDAKQLLTLASVHVVEGRTRISTAMAVAIFQTEREREEEEGEGGREVLLKTQRFGTPSHSPLPDSEIFRKMFGLLYFSVLFFKNKFLKLFEKICCFF